MRVCHNPAAAPAPLEAAFQVVARFEKISENNMRVIFTMTVRYSSQCQKLKALPEKNEENFDKLEAELAKMMEEPLATNEE